MVRASSLRTISVLYETLKSLERRSNHDPNDPVFIHLKCRILCWICELYVIAAQSDDGLDCIKQQLGRYTMDTCQPMEFVRQRKDDWTIHSYCSRCFATVADSKTAAEVIEAEEEHQCDPRLMEMVEKYRMISRLVSAA